MSTGNGYTSGTWYGNIWRFLQNNGSMNPVKQDPSSYHAGTGSGTATKAVVSPITNTFSTISGMVKTLGATSFHWDVGFFIVGMLMVLSALMRADASSTVVNVPTKASSGVAQAATEVLMA